MSDAFTMRGEDCWKCLAEELNSGGDASLAEELRDAVRDHLRNLPFSKLKMFTAVHRGRIETAERFCRLQLRCEREH